jgi:MFS family permease
MTKQEHEPVQACEEGHEAANATSSSPVPPPPDGGFHAWAQVVSGHLVVALTWGYAASFGVFQSHYESTLPQSPSDISWIGGFQVFCLLFISTLSGRATDAGMARPVVAAGAVLLVLGTFMTSLATEYWQIFLAQGLCIGLGQGLMWLPSVTLISTYFMRLRVFAVTTAATGTSTGGIIFPAMIQYLIPKIGESMVASPTCDESWANTRSRICWGSAVHGVCRARHGSSNPRPTASPTATAEVGAIG